MRYLYILSAICILHATHAMAGEIWVVKSAPKSVWVVQKPSNNLKVSAKTCPCSSECVCGCNAGKECGCNKVKVAPSIESAPFTYSNYSTGVCIGGT